MDSAVIPLKLKTIKKTLKPPRNLRKSGKNLWESVIRSYNLEEHDLFHNAFKMRLIMSQWSLWQDHDESTKHWWRKHGKSSSAPPRWNNCEPRKQYCFRPWRQQP